MEVRSCLNSVLERVSNAAAVTDTGHISYAAVISDKCGKGEERLDRDATAVRFVSTRSPKCACNLQNLHMQTKRVLNVCCSLRDRLRCELEKLTQSPS
jgi:hypothetical protein